MSANRGSTWYRFVRWGVRHLFLPALGKFTLRHDSVVPDEGAIIVAPVHFSTLDPPVVATALPRRSLTVMAKEDLFKNVLQSRVNRSLGAFPVQRGAGDLGAIKLALSLLAQGRCVMLFPEGTRGDGVHLGELQDGVALIAKRSKAKVYPLGMNGTHKALPRGRKWPRRADVTLVWGQPLDFEEITQGLSGKEAAAKFTAALEAELLRATAEAGLPLKTSKKD